MKLYKRYPNWSVVCFAVFVIVLIVVGKSFWNFKHKPSQLSIPAVNEDLSVPGKKTRMNE